MPPPELKAKEVLHSIRSGMDNSALMERYRLSDKGLQSLFKKLVAAGLIKQDEIDARSTTRKLDLTQLAQDVKQGMDDEALKKKYLLSSQDLEGIFNRLVESGAMDVEAFYERISLAESALESDPPTVPYSEYSEDEPELRSPEPRAARSVPLAPPSEEEIIKRLIRAAQQGRAEQISSILESGCDVNARDEFGDTALIVASERGYLAVVKLLLERGADVNLTDPDGRSPLACATERGHKEVVDLLNKHLAGKEDAP